ncbi:MAG: alanine racemase, partial [Alphaproteobacteria bacterium]|nr:alanine racemase [Alphaproteobacteria bacterium]
MNLTQLKSNWKWLDAKTHRHCLTASVVKANAYGHGMQAVATS